MEPISTDPSRHTAPLVSAQMLRCGHVCFGCHQVIMECPLCKGSVTRVGPNIAVCNLSRKLEATCAFECEFPEKVTVDDVLTHLKTTYPHVKVACPNEGCTTHVPREGLQSHRDVCGYGFDERCRCGVRLTRQEMAPHVAIYCPKGESKCFLGCSARSDVLGHQMTCDNAVVQCKVPGCSEVLRRCDLQKHMEVATGVHARVASRLAKRLERQLAAGDWASLVRQGYEHAVNTDGKEKWNLTKGMNDHHEHNSDRHEHNADRHEHNADCHEHNAGNSNRHSNRHYHPNAVHS
ncbi:TNF receptor-associated factor 4-like [Branchiostoma lanceolatum]|uniref:TNF receptor-associated factor 4-like n=1 Tax=Branchiostoma lanceolatum TaxID=7740 RepID=UPI0034520C32